MRKILCASVVMIALACGRATPPPPARVAAKAPEPPPPPNLLELWRGAALVSRTAEATLKDSALRAIDSDPLTQWLSPPNDSEQTLVYSLPAKTRVEQLGAFLLHGGSVSRLEFGLSLDGVNFTPVGSVAIKPNNDLQTVRVTPPVDALYVRVSTPNDHRTVQINSLYAAGAESPVTTQPPLNGCWEINGSPAEFRQRGAAVTGYVGGMEKTAIDGGFDGRIYRFAWVHGPEYGLGAMSVDPTGSHGGAIIWHEEALQIPQFLAPDWIGTRCGVAGSPVAGRGSQPETRDPRPDTRDPDLVFRTFIERVHYMPLYGLRFDERGALQESDSNATLDRVTSFLAANSQRGLRLLVHHLTAPTPQENRAIAQRKADSLRDALLRRGANINRVELVVLGAEKPRREPSNDLTRAMYNGIDLEFAR